MANYPGTYYSIVESDWLVENGYCKFRDIKFWGNNYDKNMKLLKKTKWRLIKDMNTDHIRAILKRNFCRNNKLYIEIFKKELKLRKK